MKSPYSANIGYALAVIFMHTLYLSHVTCC